MSWIAGHRRGVRPGSGQWIALWRQKTNVPLASIKQTAVLFTDLVAWRLDLKKPTATGFFTLAASRWRMIIGYARVSTTEQNRAPRYDELKPAFDASVDHPVELPLTWVVFIPLTLEPPPLGGVFPFRKSTFGGRFKSLATSNSKPIETTPSKFWFAICGYPLLICSCTWARLDGYLQAMARVFARPFPLATISGSRSSTANPASLSAPASSNS
jgi:hypothetical protein